MHSQTALFATQIFSIERLRADYDGKQISHEIVYGVSTHDPKIFGPAEILKLNRDHWVIENKLHCVRDEFYQEDRSRIRKQNGSQIMATLRNLAITLMRDRGITNIKEAANKFLMDKKALWSFLGLVAGNVCPHPSQSTGMGSISRP